MYNLKIGDTIKIRNTSGLLNVTLEKKLNMRNVTRGLHDDLGQFNKLRIEFHENCGEQIISLYDAKENGTDIYLIFNYENSLSDVEIWMGTIPEKGETEENIFVTYKYEE